MKLVTFVAHSSVGAKYQRGEGSIFHLNNAIITGAFLPLLGILESLISGEVSVGLGIDMRNADIKNAVCPFLQKPLAFTYTLASSVVFAVRYW